MESPFFRFRTNTPRGVRLSSLVMVSPSMIIDSYIGMVSYMVRMDDESTSVLVLKAAMIVVKIGFIVLSENGVVSECLFVIHQTNVRREKK